MIRLATSADTMKVVGLLRLFLSETSYEQAKHAIDDLENLCKVVWTVHQFGYIWLAFDQEDPVGLLMAVKEPNMWSPKHKQLRELVWYVRPEYRTSTLGGKLFLKYCELGDDLMNNNIIEGYFTTRMATSPEINLERRGFRLKEYTYLKER